MAQKKSLMLQCVITTHALWQTEGVVRTGKGENSFVMKFENVYGLRPCMSVVT